MELVNKKLNLCDEVQLQLYKEDKEYYIDAEDLWKWLEVKTKFTDWIKRRIKQYEFKEKDYICYEYCKLDKSVFKFESLENTGVQNFDYICYYYKVNELKNEFVKNINEFKNPQQASRNGYSIKYYLKSDMAKQLAMVEDAKKGRLIRQFYLDLEQYVTRTDQLDMFRKFRKEEKHETYDFYNTIGHKGKCVALSKCIYNIVSYRFDLPFKHNKEQIVTLAKYRINEDAYQLYLEIKEKAESFVDTFMALDEEHFMKNTMDLLYKKYIDDIDKFTNYCANHKEEDLTFEVNVKEHYGKGFGIEYVNIPKN